MARAEVHSSQGEEDLRVETRNVRTLAVPGRVLQFGSESTISRPARRYGPLIRILASKGPVIIAHGHGETHADLALRIAHDLFVHHRLAVSILNDRDCLEAISGRGVCGNLVLLGRPEDNVAVRYCLRRQVPPSEFGLARRDGGSSCAVRFIGRTAIEVGTEVYDEAGSGEFPFGM